MDLCFSGNSLCFGTPNLPKRQAGGQKLQPDDRYFNFRIIRMKFFYDIINQVICFHKPNYNFIILFLNNWIEANVITTPMVIKISIFGRIASNGSTLQNMS